MKKNLHKYTILLVLLAMGIISTVITDGAFARPENIMNLAVQVVVNGILAVGMTLIILTGGIDLGVGSVMALIGVVVAKLQLTYHFSTWSSVLISLALGLGIGLWNGFFITKFKLPPFIVTLGSMTIARGLALVISKGSAIAPVNNTFAMLATWQLPSLVAVVLTAIIGGLILFRNIRNKHWLDGIATALVTLFVIWVLLNSRGLPLPVIIFAIVAALGIFVLKRTTFGRYLYAYGGNVQATRLSGINVDKLLIWDYVIMGGLAALAGLVLASRMAAGVPTAGNMAELDAIASVVIGGTSLAGGAGAVGGSVIGAFIIGLLNNVLVILNVEANYQYIIKGFIIMGAVMLDTLKQKRG
ncbi:MULTISPECIES: sugar ABC transporter permease [Carboxydocella]|uniref:D-xylose transport system permease protein n=2 Tax=Carboxydocella TaxID=178898 RepID=A0A1T4MT99_9FIRM|nr:MULTISPECIES: hypothetical protein [Carboxydocella]AVX20339.1 xylose ABC transporter membrane protein [Carboxydocella thermautotrophica]AVX30763.1 xylose ABC transporter membrane protein [Carboxydocella thermautotrophica]SJZ70131.1 D-xylose transport system permease protein [Carboxydocella sporoproducens DSM 16521]GAW30090.1 inner-membrane translocator [Carboxydocella sp. ULO1]GAW31169.1 inner-membrane translocator [Carboxydocella sp. JDF658]